ncbi:unnamed protein product [Danaus chrysippus]|uniref:(African queen) hypothetical protein n=1 Tax=Danaus chrysippus TaxID=151541 RepID=A0A8J2W605_9NEOP|nr:unnamed protein product [Danaus chrysippus]
MKQSNREPTTGEDKHARRAHATLPNGLARTPANLLDSLHDFYVRTYRNLIHVVQPHSARAPNTRCQLTLHQEQESGRTTIRSNSSDACFQHFLFICLHRKIPLGVTSDNLNWLAKEQGFASYPSGSASVADLFYIQVCSFRLPDLRDVQTTPQTL